MDTLLDREEELVNLFMSTKPAYPLVSACAAAGNAARENNCLCVTSGKKDHGSDGLFQWRKQRLTSLKAFATANKAKWEDMATQVEFFKAEVADTHGFAFLKRDLEAGTKSIETLTADICDIYERPAPAVAGLDVRIANAKRIYSVMQQKTKRTWAGWLKDMVKPI